MLSGNSYLTSENNVLHQFLFFFSVTGIPKSSGKIIIHN